MKKPAWSGNWPIPKTVKLPGLLIKVVVVPADEARLREMPYGIWVYEHASQHAEIHINGAHPLPLQRYILWHELQHAVVEAVDVMIEKYPDHVMTVSMMTLKALSAQCVDESHLSRLEDAESHLSSLSRFADTTT